jgi:hypothetical protein
MLWIYGASGGENGKIFVVLCVEHDVLYDDVNFDWIIYSAQFAAQDGIESSVFGRISQIRQEANTVNGSFDEEKHYFYVCLEKRHYTNNENAERFAQNEMFVAISKLAEILKQNE